MAASFRERILKKLPFLEKIPFRRIEGIISVLIIFIAIGFIARGISPLALSSEEGEKFIEFEGGGSVCDIQGCLRYNINEGPYCYENNEWECIDADDDGCPGVVTVTECEYDCNKATGVCYPENCGNGVCDNSLTPRDLGETCHNCSSDCACRQEPNSSFPVECHEVRDPDNFQDAGLAVGDWICMQVTVVCGNGACEDQEHMYGELPCKADCGEYFDLYNYTLR